VADLVTARRAEPADIDTTSTLADLAAAAVRTERGGRWHLDHDSDRSPATERHHAALQTSDRTLVVGCIDETVVGYALAALSGTVDGTLCMIEELVVHPDAQAVGVGSAILQEVRRWAIEHGCLALESQVLPGNREAKNFFERVGMKTRKMRVSTDLG